MSSENHNDCYVRVAAFHFRVIDADKIAREIMEPGRPAFKEVVASFGEGIVTSQGQINRQKLGELVSRRDDEITIAVAFHMHLQFIHTFSTLKFLIGVPWSTNSLAW